MSPASGAEWNKLFKSTDVLAESDKQTKALGLTPGNLADPWALYWSYAWLMTQRRGDDPTRAQLAGLYTQMQKLMLAVLSVAPLTDAQQQEMSDPLLLQVTLFGVLAEAWKNDPASFKQCGDGLAQGSRSMGFDLTLLELTDQGFAVGRITIGNDK